ncbi:MAG: hypothetical protein RIA63_01810, partial [Cyclobacteriaceae bacterium]
MKFFNLILFASILLLPAPLIHAQRIVYGDPNPKSPLAEVYEAEKWFSRSCAQIGLHLTSIEYVADDGILFMPGPVKAKEFMK